jgi:hypothetical protein
MDIERRFILLGAMVGFLFEVINANGTSAALTTKIEAALPKYWSVTERKSGVLPQGHYWGQDYSGIRGEEVLLQGSADVHVTWQDSKGDWHSDAVGKEALRLYVMPSTYRESLLRFFIPKRPVSARLLVETDSFKVYAYPSTRVLDKEKVDRAIKQGKTILWPDSPENTKSLSWDSWSTDLPRVLKGRQ